MIKRVVFEERWLPYLLIGPQLLIIFLFFYWPTGQALFWSFTLEPPFGGDAVWVGLRNIAEIVVSPVYHSAIRNTLIMSVSTTAIALGLGLIFAVFADPACAARSSTRPRSCGPMLSQHPSQLSPGNISSSRRSASWASSTNGTQASGTRR